ncbi:MAG: hypothetical protein AAF358_19780 [Pseudomonadota bacterium]
MLTELSPKALLAGTLAFVGTFLVISMAATLAANNATSLFDAGWFWLALSVLGTAMLGIGGYVSGRMAGRQGLLHGFVVGLLGLAIILSIVGVAFSRSAAQEIIFSYGLYGMFFNCLGGWLGAYASKESA